VRDKYTGEPRNFCFVQFHTVSDAGRALQLLQVCAALLASLQRAFISTNSRRLPFCARLGEHLFLNCLTGV
jgi:RNA recognition motif-containing protein